MGIFKLESVHPRGRDSEEEKSECHLSRARSPIYLNKLIKFI